MEYRRLGRSGLKVSALCLGAMMFGDRTDEAEAKRILASAREAGVNFVDTADAYANEIYPSKRSRFWLSPSFGSDRVRIDIFWFKSGRTDPDQVFYPQYWELLQDFGFRAHWGKHLPPASSSTGLAYRQQLLPMWSSFMKVRERMDPWAHGHQVVFL